MFCVCLLLCFKQKTAYEMRISDWSSDVCSSDLTLTNSYAREMAASLRSIESQIGGFASLLVRAGNINASDGVNTGFKTDTTGKLLSGILTGGGLLSKVPILGGLLGAIGGVVKSLFGTKTSVIGSGLYGDEQSLKDILGGRLGT